MAIISLWLLRRCRASGVLTYKSNNVRLCSQFFYQLSTTAAAEKQAFDVDQAASLVKDLRNNFHSGKTKSYEWRVVQLQRTMRMLEENQKKIVEALYKDLAKPEPESFLWEISMTKASCKLILEQLQGWMMPEKVKTNSATMSLSSAEIVSEPLGVVLVIHPGTFHFVMAIHLLIDVLCIFPVLSLDPVIGAIAAGNTVVVKPSEISSATSSVLSNLLEEYVDNSAIRVVEGSVAETSALLEQKWDKIFFTAKFLAIY
ncbi:hypothetical protein SLA2020_036100 [Shorea laevis]